MIWIRLAIATARLGLIGLVVFASAAVFAASSVAETLSRILGDAVAGEHGVTFGLVPVDQIGIWAGAVMVGIPAVISLFSRQLRSIGWLGALALLVQLPAVLAHSKLDWWRYLDRWFSETLLGNGPSITVSTVAIVVTLAALLLLIVIHDLQQDVRRLQRARYPLADITQFISGHLATAVSVLVAAAALTGMTLALAWFVAGAVPASIVKLPWALVAIGMLAVAVVSVIVYLFASPSGSDRPIPSTPRE
ncbi:MAG: hypothetical protein HY678_03450 [Chloroflexi bacterium]|nr:hypothetical protein [Chloroflexota bacterium]